MSTEELQIENEDVYEKLTFVVDKGQEPMRIDKWVQMRIVGLTRSKLQNGIEGGFLTVNGKVIKSNYRTRPGDEVVYMSYVNPDYTELKPEQMALDIVYEDDALMVINKPSNMVVHHTVERKYVALVWGNMEDDEATVNAHIARHKTFRKIYDAYPEGEVGKHAITHYKVIERYNYTTLVSCVLETGRTHQIRVHMKHIGHTLFNDQEYGGDRILKGTIYTKYKQFVDNCFDACPRCALHAATLGFIHPSTEEMMRFDSPLPSDMEAAITKWKNYKAAAHT